MKKATRIKHHGGCVGCTKDIYGSEKKPKQHVDYALLEQAHKRKMAKTGTLYFK